MLIAPYSAISPWDGYIYQGNVAIYHFSNSILENSTSAVYGLNDLILEIEYSDDFAIKSKDIYISLQQAKSGNLNLNDKDKFCFVISCLKYKASRGYYHIISSQSSPNDFVEKTSKIIDEYRNYLQHYTVKNTVISWEYKKMLIID